MINYKTNLRFIKKESIYSHHRAGGFTLIEFLVVIAIIGILSTLVIVSLGNSRASARDAKRLNDLRAVANGLELYYSNHSSYPDTLTPGEPLESGGIVYIASVPNNPTPWTDGGCPDNNYIYAPKNSGQSYTISTCLGTPAPNSPSVNFTTVSYSPNGLFQCGQQAGDLDGNQYNTVQIGTQCWMKENLAYLPSVNEVTDGSTSDPKYYVYGYSGTDVEEAKTEPGSNYSTHGVLYNWPAANTACPEGWKLPTDQEFNDLEQYTVAVINSSENQYDCYTGGATWERCADNNGTPNGGAKGAGKSLKKVGEGTGDDLVGFSLMLSGYRHGSGFAHLASRTHLWLAPQVNASTALKRFFLSGSSTVPRVNNNKIEGFSVRCLKD